MFYVLSISYLYAYIDDFVCVSNIQLSIINVIKIHLITNSLQ